MRKLLIAFVLMFALSFVSCNKSVKNTVMSDTTTVATDSVDTTTYVVDSIDSVDSVK